MHLGKRARRRAGLFIAASASVLAFVIAASALSPSLLESFTLSAVDGIPHSVANDLATLRPGDSCPAHLWSMAS